MNSARNSLTGKAFILVLLACCAVLLLNLRVMAQETNYTEEQYKAFEEIKGEQAALKKATLAVKFVQVPANAKCGLLRNVQAEFATAMQSLQKAGNWSEVLKLGEPWVAAVPDDSYVIGLLAEGYAESKNYKQFTAFGEKVFARSPNANLAYQLAKAYQELGNDAKFIQWSEKTISLDPSKPDMLFELTRSYGAAKRWPEATKYANLTLKAIAAGKPASTTDAAWKEYTVAASALSYGVLGTAAYEGNNLVQAINNLEKSASFNKRNEPAYYYLGMAYWKMQKSDMAMLNFAKAYVMHGSTSASAKGYLDQLYKAGAGRGTLAGEERIVNRAKMDLGIQ